MIYGFVTQSDLLRELDNCSISRLYVNGVTVNKLASNYPCKRTEMSAKLRAIFMRISKRKGAELSHPIVLARLRLPYDYWMDAISEYEDYLHSKLLK